VSSSKTFIVPCDAFVPVCWEAQFERVTTKLSTEPASLKLIPTSVKATGIVTSVFCPVFTWFVVEDELEVALAALLEVVSAPPAALFPHD